MNRRVARRMETSLPASHPVETLLDPELDPSLWSKLPQDNLLDIYNALPVIDHYRLRIVCKQWHNKASERRRMPTQGHVRLRRPFILLIQKSAGECSPVGTLALDVRSEQWIWRSSKEIKSSGYGCRPPIGHLGEAFEVEGVYFGGRALSDVHQNNRRITSNAAPGSVLGMMVDDISRAYTLILGSCAADTIVLSSSTNKWESKPSRLVRIKPPSVSTAPKSCVQLQGKMYLWMDSDEIHVYSPSSNQWSALAAPPRAMSNEDEFRGLGHWAGSLYAVTKNEQGTLSVWKLNMGNEQWSEYARIPGWLFTHLMQPGAVLPIVASHCNGYLLIHLLAQPNASRQRQSLRSAVNLATMSLGELLQKKWPGRRKPMKLDRRFVLFNIANRRWEIVHMPYLTMWTN